MLLSPDSKIVVKGGSKGKVGYRTEENSRFPASDFLYKTRICAEQKQMGSSMPGNAKSVTKPNREGNIKSREVKHTPLYHQVTSTQIYSTLISAFPFVLYGHTLPSVPLYLMANSKETQAAQSPFIHSHISY